MSDSALSDFSNPSHETMATEDDRQLHVRRWHVGAPKGLIVIAHGLGEYGGWYRSFANALAGAGYATLAHDQQGHGQSDGRRGDAPSLDRLVGDLERVVCRGLALYPDAPVVLFGHSMGGHLVLKYLIERRLGIGYRAIVTNPMILPHEPPTRAQAFAAWLTGRVLPRLRFSSGVQPEQLTRDEDALRRLASDPLIHERLSLRIGGDLMASGHALVRRADQLNANTLMLLGGDDQLCDQASTQRFIERAGETCESVVFDPMRHNLLHELHRERVQHTILNWLATLGQI
jgi:alpha-beta hydrolase superfamily lysophospholipase